MYHTRLLQCCFCLLYYTWYVCTLQRRTGTMSGRRQPWSNPFCLQQCCLCWLIFHGTSVHSRWMFHLTTFFARAARCWCSSRVAVIPRSRVAALLWEHSCLSFDPYNTSGIICTNAFFTLSRALYASTLSTPSVRADSSSWWNASYAVTNYWGGENPSQIQAVSQWYAKRTEHAPTRHIARNKRKRTKKK